MPEAETSAPATQAEEAKPLKAKTEKPLTPKQQAFVAAYIKTGNASEAYRQAYDAENMKPEVIAVKASELLKNGNVTVRLQQIQGAAAKKVALDRAWVLDRLMRNARIAMGEERIKISVQPKGGKEDTVVELEITDRDAGAANKALELLGKTTEAPVFKDVVEHTGAVQLEVIPRPTGEDHLKGLSCRYGSAKGKAA